MQLSAGIRDSSSQGPVIAESAFLTASVMERVRQSVSSKILPMERNRDGDLLKQGCSLFHRRKPRRRSVVHPGPGQREFGKTAGFLAAGKHLIDI